MKLSPRDEIIVGVVVVILLVVALSMLLVRPQFAALSDVSKRQAEEETKIRNAEAELQLLKAAKSEALQVQADLIKVNNRVPDSPQLPSLVVEIQDLANEAGIDFISIKPAEMVATGEYTTLPIELGLHGQFFDVVDFLYRLQHLTREIRVEKLDLSKQLTPGGESAAEDDGGLDLSITANVYVMGSVPGAQAPKEAPGSGGQTPAPSGK